MKAHIPNPYQRGKQDGAYLMLAEVCMALHNLYGWGREPMARIGKEVMRIAEAARNNSDVKFEVEQYIKMMEESRCRKNGI